MEKSKADLKRRIAQLKQELANTYHYSNCMMYAGTSCDCGVSETESKLKELEEEYKKLK